MEMPFAEDAAGTEIRDIRRLLEQRRPYLKFPPMLETAFQLHMQGRILELLVRGWWTLLLFYLLIGICTYIELHMLSYPTLLAGNLAVWWRIYLIEGVVLAALLVLPRLSLRLSHYQFCLGLIAALAVATIIVGTSAFPDPYFNHHSSYVVIFVLALVYGIGAFRLGWALLICGTATLTAWLAIWRFELWLDKGLFLQYVVLANIAGLLMCHIVEQRDRRMFLQGQLLTEEKAMLSTLSSELSRLAREDALTGLANRRHFNDVFQTEWERARREAQPLALIFVDIDHFKPFNDVHGHIEGDAVLAEIGGALKNCLHRPGDLAVRFGGEEFVLLLPCTPLAGAVEVARHVQAAIAALHLPHRASGVAPHVTASVGVAALVPTLEMRSVQLVALADEAAYAAKAAGRNCIRVAEGAAFVPVAAA